MSTTTKSSAETLAAKPAKTKKAISNFIDTHYRHFNAASIVDASKAYIEHLDAGGKMMITLAGAMSTAELGV